MQSPEKQQPVQHEHLSEERYKVVWAYLMKTWGDQNSPLPPDIQASELADGSYQMIIDDIRHLYEDYYINKAIAAKWCDLDPTPWQLQALPFLRGMLSKTATPGSEQSQAAEQWQRMINEIDPQLDGLLDNYVMVYNELEASSPDSLINKYTEYDTMTEEVYAEWKTARQRLKDAGTLLEDYMTAMAH